MAQRRATPAGETDLLPREVEKELALRWRDNQDYDARARIVAAYRMMAVAWAHKAARGGLSIDDLEQEANIGLMSALDRFDPEMGYGFGTFARYHVISRIQIYTLENVAPLRIFNTAVTKALLSRYNRLKREIEERTGRPLGEDGRDEICERLNLAREQLDRFEMAVMPSVSIDVGAGNSSDDDALRPTQIADPDADTERKAMGNIVNRQINSILAEIFAGMAPRDEEVVRARYLQDPASTLDELSKTLGISRERVRQIELRAMRKLAEGLRERGIEKVSDILIDP